MGCTLGIGCLTEAVSIIADGYMISWLTNLGGYKLRWPCNLLFVISEFLYMAARLIVIVEIVISLRFLPSGCFKVVQWSHVLPHF